MADETPEIDQQQADPDPNATPVDDGVSGGDAGTPQNVEQAAEQALGQVEQAAEAIMTETSPAPAPASAPAPAPASTPAPGQAEAYDLPDIANAPSASPEDVAGLSLLNDVDLKVKIELGRTHMYVEDVLQLTQDSVIELDKAAGDPVDIFVNNRLVARGEVLVLNENFCVRISEIVAQTDAEE